MLYSHINKFETLYEAYNYFSTTLPDPNTTDDVCISNMFIIADEKTNLFAVKNESSEGSRWDFSL